jgi:hypothetical protein
VGQVGRLVGQDRADARVVQVREEAGRDEDVGIRGPTHRGRVGEGAVEEGKGRGPLQACLQGDVDEDVMEQGRARA